MKKTYLSGINARGGFIFSSLFPFFLASVGLVLMRWVLDICNSLHVRVSEVGNVLIE